MEAMSAEFPRIKKQNALLAFFEIFMGINYCFLGYFLTFWVD
jgi:hypothetical protein